MPTPFHALAGERAPAPSATVIPLAPIFRARRSRDLARAVQHRSVAVALVDDALFTLDALAEHAAGAGGLTGAGALGLQVATLGLRAAVAELAAAQRAVDLLSGGVEHA